MGFISGYKDMGEYLRGWYETSDLEMHLRGLLKQLQPLYSQLHAYVRARLQKQYPQHRFPKSGHIPAHILGERAAHCKRHQFLKVFRNELDRSTSVQMADLLTKVCYHLYLFIFSHHFLWNLFGDVLIFCKINFLCNRIPFIKFLLCFTVRTHGLN